MDANRDDLDTLLSQITHNKSYNALDGLEPVRDLLESDTTGEIATALHARMPSLPDKVRGGIAFALAERFLHVGDLPSINALYAEGDAETQEGVLDGLWSEPYAHPDLGPGVVALAIKGARHSEPEVRTEAASVLQNQAGWGVPMSDAFDALRELLKDPVPRVRQQAAYAVGNVAQGTRRIWREAARAAGIAAPKKPDLSVFLPDLVENLRHSEHFVRESGAWALSRIAKRHDITNAVAPLVTLLSSSDANDEPRKNAAGALLHYARESGQNLERVKSLAANASLDPGRKEIARFLQKLDALTFE